MAQVKSYGTLLEYGNTADYATASTWVALTTCGKIQPQQVTSAKIDVTHLTSPNEFEESIPGLANGGDIEAELQYDKTQTSTVFAFFRTVKAWRIRYVDNSGWKMNGFIDEWGDQEVVNGDIVRQKIKIHCNALAFDTDLLT